MSNPTVQQSPMSTAFIAKDMKKSIAFYTDVLGFQMKESWPSADNPWWCNLLYNGQSIMLGVDMDEACAEPSGGEGGGGPSHPEGMVDWYKTCVSDWRTNKSGCGVTVYLLTEDVDAYHAAVTGKGGEARYEPHTQFYGIRDFGIEDPDGYKLLFYSPVTLSECQSCAMPLADAEPGQMYCDFCTDETGHLRPYEDVFEGTVTGYFMGMQKLERGAAEVAAKAHLAKLPAWLGRD